MKYKQNNDLTSRSIHSAAKWKKTQSNIFTGFYEKHTVVLYA